MNAVLRAFTSVAAMASVLAPSAVSSAPRPKIAFMSTEPVTAAESADTGLRLFSFGEKIKKHRGGTETRTSQGFYDEVVGVACSTTSQTFQLESQKITVPRVMVRHECHQMSQPRAWKDAPATQIGKADESRRGFSLTGDNENMIQRTTLVSAQGISFFMRSWRKADHTVCLAMGELKISGQGMEVTSVTDNGCYKMTPVEFFMKRQTATAGKPQIA